jgi:hypothetical protein
MMTNPREPGQTSSEGFGGSTASGKAGTIDGAYRLLMIRGLTSVEAGNVVASINGLRPTERGWTIEEVKNLLAIRSLVATGIIDS